VWKYEDVIAFYEKYYVPQNMVLSIVTPISFDTIVRYMKKTHFVKPVSRKNTIGPILNTVPKMLYDKQIGIQIGMNPVKNIQTAYLAVSFRTCSLYSDDRYALDVLRSVLGATFTSRMFTILREKNGLTYTSNVSTTYYEHSGDIRLTATTDSKKLIHNRSTRQTRKRGKTSLGVLPLIMDIIMDLVKNGVSEKELNETKRYLQGKLALRMENADTQVSYNGIQLFLHNADKIDTYRVFSQKHIQQITRDQIHAVIKTYFKPDNMNVAIVGGELPSKSSIEKLCMRYMK